MKKAMFYYLSKEERVQLVKEAKKVQRLEMIWRRKLRKYYEEITKKVLANAKDTGRIKEELVDFESFIIDHFFEISREGYESSHRLSQKKNPKTLKDLLEIWKKWREGRSIPTRQQAIAKKMKKEYLKKIKSVWEKYSEPFRNGKEFDQEKARVAIEEEVGTAYGKATTIVNTETTRYYNKARRNFYDRSEDVTHYLFLCIRDHRTTQWCRTRTGIVYTKGDPLLDKETPPIHWNCRSEMTPLTPSNPDHLKLINDKRHRRRNNICEPLPKNWVASGH